MIPVSTRKSSNGAVGLIALLLPVITLQCASSGPRGPSDTVEVHGVIRDREGVGVEGVGVMLAERMPYGSRTIAGATTDGGGAFRFRARPGRYIAILFARDLRVPSVFMDSTVIGPPSVRLDYRYGGFKVEGRLVGPDERPVRAGAIEVSGQSPDFRYGINFGARLNEGRYKLFLPRGSYYFKTKPLPEYLPGTEGPPAVDIDADTTMDLSADGNLVQGCVRVGRRSWQGAHVHVYGETWPGKVMVNANNSTGSDGRFRFYLPNGHYSFGLNPGSAAPHIFPRWLNHEVRGPETLDMNFPVVQWSGTVRDTMTGREAQHVRIEARDTRSSLSAVCASDKAGRFLLLLEPGHGYLLLVSGRRNEISPRQEWIMASRDSAFDLLVRRSP